MTSSLDHTASRASAPARFAKGLRRAAIIGAFILLAACQTELYSGYSDRSVNEMIRVLAASGIEATRVPSEADGLYGVTVNRRDFARAITVLSENGLPRQKYGGLGTVFEDNTIVSTPFEERARFMYAISQELSASLTKIAGVTDASVHVNVPEDRPLAGETQASRASVFIYRDPSVDLQSAVPTIKALITNAVDGLEYEDVEVAIFDARAPTTLPMVRPGEAFSIPALIGYGVLALVGLFLWRKLTGRRPTRRITGEGSRRVVGPVR